jgi:hypothetical protein
LKRSGTVLDHSRRLNDDRPTSRPAGFLLYQLIATHPIIKTPHHFIIINISLTPTIIILPLNLLTPPNLPSVTHSADKCFLTHTHFYSCL